jgi:serine protease Do
MPGEGQIAATGTGPSGETGRLGVYLAPLTPEARREHGIRPGSAGVLVAEVEPHSPAARAGLRAGTVISMVGQQPVSQPEQAVALIREAARQGRPSVLLRVDQNGQQRFVPVPFQD